MTTHPGSRCLILASILLWGCSSSPPPPPASEATPEVASDPPKTSPPASSAPSTPAQPKGYQLAKATGWDEMENLVGDLGCRLTSRDKSRLACLDSELDMGFLTVTLSVRTIVDGAEVTRFTLFDGTSGVEAEGYKPGFEQANQLLAEDGYQKLALTTGDGRTAVIEGKELRLGAGELSGTTATPALPVVAPTDRLAKQVSRCCHWEVDETYFLLEPKQALTKLTRQCTWGRRGAAAKGTPWQCQDRDFNEENDSEQSTLVATSLARASASLGPAQKCDPKWKQMKGCPKSLEPICVIPQIRCIRAPCPRPPPKQYQHPCRACQDGHSQYRSGSCPTIK